LKREIWMIPTAGGTPKQLTSDGRMIFGLAWTADSSSLVFSSRREGLGENLWRIPTGGGAPKRLPFRGAMFPSISTRGDRMAYTQSFLDTNIYRSDGPGFGGGATPGRFGAGKELIHSSREDDSPVFSPDGQWIAFVSTRSGNSEIWMAKQDGGRAT